MGIEPCFPVHGPSRDWGWACDRTSAEILSTFLSSDYWLCYLVCQRALYPARRAQQCFQHPIQHLHHQGHEHCITYQGLRWRRPLRIGIPGTLTQNSCVMSSNSRAGDWTVRQNHWTHWSIYPDIKWPSCFPMQSESPCLWIKGNCCWSHTRMNSITE